VRRFLEEGHKVKVTIMFRGRERTHPELGERILVRVAESLADIGAPEGTPSMMGMDMNMIMTPRAEKPAKKERAAEDAPSAPATGAPAAEPAPSEPVANAGA
jgi:translation initiation factor IF-3